MRDLLTSTTFAPMKQSGLPGLGGEAAHLRSFIHASAAKKAAGEVFDSAAEFLIAGIADGKGLPGDVMTHVAFFRVKGMAVNDRAAGLPATMHKVEKDRWATLARFEYQQRVKVFFQTMLHQWEERAPHCKNLFRRAAADAIPLVSMPMIFPDDYPAEVRLNASQEDALWQTFPLVADLGAIDRGPESGQAIPAALRQS